MSGKPVRVPQEMLPYRRRSFWNRWSVWLATGLLAVSTASITSWEMQQRRVADIKSLADRAALHEKLNGLEAAGTRRITEHRELIDSLNRVARDVRWLRERFEQSPAKRGTRKRSRKGGGRG